MSEIRQNGLSVASQGLDTTDILQIWRPQTNSGQESQFYIAISKQYWELSKRNLRKMFLRTVGKNWHRGQTTILAAYDRQWKKKGWEKYRPRPLESGGSAWVWGKRRFMLSNEAGAAIRLVYLEAAIRQLAPTSVLEVGCGNGINLHPLAAAMPDVAFTGLEPTEHGYKTAQGVATGEFPDALRAFAPFPLQDEAARAAFVQGSGDTLPFADNSFDVVMTSLALEQMEEIRDAALREIARVAKHHVIMLEPFREVNASGLRRAYIKTYDYFQGRIDDLKAYGLEPVSVVTDMPHKAWLGTALVIARKVGASSQ